MSFLLPLIMFACIVLVVAMLGTEGMWSAGIMLINTILAAILAMSFWEPLSAYLLNMNPGGEFFWDFFALMGLFLVFLMVFRSMTDKLSKKRVVFLKPVDIGGGVVLAAFNGWVMVCFLLAAVQTAPIGRDFAWGGFVPEQRTFFGLAPDRLWLAFCHRMSTGPLAPVGASDDPNAPHVFDPRGEFLIKYATHRERYASPESVDAGISGVIIPSAPPPQ